MTVGEQGTASSSMIDTATFDPETRLSWRNGQLVYQNVRLEDLLQDLNRYLPKRMTLSDDRLADLRVSAVFRLGDQQAMLEALSHSLPIRWKSLSDSLIIISPNPA